MTPALAALTAVNLYDGSVQKSAAELVELAVSDAISYIGESAMIANKTSDAVVEKLKLMKLWVMFPDEILNVTKIDGLYSELDLDGSESNAELSIKLILYSWKLQLHSKNKWIKTLINIITFYPEIISYFSNNDLLCKYDKFFDKL